MRITFRSNINVKLDRFSIKAEHNFVQNALRLFY